MGWLWGAYRLPINTLWGGFEGALKWLRATCRAEAAEVAELVLLQRCPGTTLELLWGRSHVGRVTI